MVLSINQASEATYKFPVSLKHFNKMLKLSSENLILRMQLLVSEKNELNCIKTTTNRIDCQFQSINVPIQGTFFSTNLSFHYLHIDGRSPVGGFETK